MTDGKRGYLHADERRSEILACARDMIEERGLSKVSMKDLARESGISRGTVYYHFPDKDHLVDAVIDDYIEDLTEALAIWEETRPKGMNRAGVRSAIELVQRLVNERSYLRRNLTETENAGLYARFSGRAVEKLVEKLDDTTIRYYAGRYRIEIDHLHETFYILISGLIRYLRSHPDADIDVLTEVAAQTLRIPLEER